MQIGIYGCMSYLHCGTCRQYGHLNTTDLERVRGSTKSASAIPIHLRFRTRVQYNGRVCSIGIGSLKWEGLFHRQRFTKMGGLVPQVKVQYNGRVSSIGRGSVLWEVCPIGRGSLQQGVLQRGMHNFFFHHLKLFSEAFNFNTT